MTTKSDPACRPRSRATTGLPGYCECWPVMTNSPLIQTANSLSAFISRTTLPATAPVSWVVLRPSMTAKKSVYLLTEPLSPPSVRTGIAFKNGFCIEMAPPVNLGCVKFTIFRLIISTKIVVLRLVRGVRSGRKNRQGGPLNNL